MTRVLSIVSGKGGVGKTTTALSLAVAFVNMGDNVVVVDANILTPHLGINLGSPNLTNHLHDVLKGKKKLNQAIYHHASGIKVIPGKISHNPMHESNSSVLKDVAKGLRGTTDIVILDGPPGFGKEVIEAINASDNVIIVTNPELSSISDALRAIKLAKTLNVHVLGVILNRVRSDSLEMSVRNVEELLATKIIGIIPEDEAVREAAKLKQPVVHSHPQAESSVAFKKVVASLLGKSYAEKLEKEEQRSQYSDIMKRLGLK